jgi:hypothetical protein
MNDPAGRSRHTLTGYARVSTADQNPDHQIDTLIRAGVDHDNIHIDTASGAKASRPKLDRLSRSVLQRELIVADATDGLAAARARGRVGGPAQAHHRPGHAHPAALRRAREDRPADRRHVRSSQIHGVRAPRPGENPAPTAEEDHRRQAQLATSGLLAPWCLG